MSFSDFNGIPTSANSLNIRVSFNIGQSVGSSNNNNKRFQNYSVNNSIQQTIVADNRYDFGAFTFVDSATLGSKVVINCRGIFSFTYSDRSVGGSNIGLAVSTPQSPATTATAIQNQSQQNILAIDTNAANARGSVSYVGWFNPGDEVFPNTDSATANGNETSMHVCFLGPQS